jgi:hypothetical protein
VSGRSSREVPVSALSSILQARNMQVA